MKKCNIYQDNYSIIIPQGEFADVCCGECDYGGYNSSRDEIKCKRDGKWHPWNDSCRYFVEGDGE